MFCKSCGEKLPDDANFCMKCGQALRSDSTPRGAISWEYKDITIPLTNVSNWGEAPANDRTLCESYDRCILPFLQREAAEGWLPEQPTDLPNMLNSGRVKRHGLLRWTCEKVSIRLRRPI